MASSDLGMSGDDGDSTNVRLRRRKRTYGPLLSSSSDGADVYSEHTVREDFVHDRATHFLQALQERLRRDPRFSTIVVIQEKVYDAGHSFVAKGFSGRQGTTQAFRRMICREYFCQLFPEQGNGVWAERDADRVKFLLERAPEAMLRKHLYLVKSGRLEPRRRLQELVGLGLSIVSLALLSIFYSNTDGDAYLLHRLVPWG